MDEIYINDIINLSFEARYPYPIKTVELRLERGNLIFPHECSIKDNIISALVKGEECGRHVAWFKCLFEDNSIRSFPIDFIVKERKEEQSKGIGSFSVPVQTNAEQENQAAETTDSNMSKATQGLQEVDPVVETNKRTPVAENKESYFEKEFSPDEEFEVGMKEEKEHEDVVRKDPEKIKAIVMAHLKEDKHYYSKLKKIGLIHKEYIDSDIIYEQIDEFLLDNSMQKMAHLIEPKQQLPLGAKSLADKLEYNTYSSLRNMVNDWFSKIEKLSNPEEVVIDLKKEILKWQRDIITNQMDDFQQLFSKGLEAGIRQTGVPVDEKYIGDVNYAVLKSTGIGPAIENFGNDVFDKIYNIVMKHYKPDIGIPLYRSKRDIDSYLHNARYNTQRMMRTEVAKMSNHGVLKAWERDPDKNFFAYKWLNPEDDRSKKISLLRKQGNDYSFSEISFLWKNQLQKIDNGWQNDIFNQRCSISRGERLEKEWNDNRFLGRETEFKETT